MGVVRRLVAGALVLGGVTFLAPGVASAHFWSLTTGAVCLESGDWQATATLTVSAPGPIAGTTTITPPATTTSWTLNADETRTFATETLPTSVSSVTFNIAGTWSDNQAFTDSATVSQPENCTSSTTTTLPCEFDPELPPDDPGCQETTTTSTTTSTSSTTTTTLPCEFDPELPPDDPGCQETTTTTTPSVLSITAISPICLRDAPYIEVTFGNQPVFNGRPATVTFIDLNGNVVGTETATYQAGTTVRFVYPGASIDAAGNPTDWPGWVFDGDEWVVDPTDAFLREGLTVVVEVNPTASDTVSYPPATPSCTADPTTTPPGTLPQTR